MLFFQREIEGPVTMLNLLRFHDQADYSASPELAPPQPITGQEAYEIYVNLTTPFLEEVGGTVSYLGRGGHYLIGPIEERWDLVLLVKHRSVQVFMSMAENSAYMSVLGHRTAALADSRLLPIETI